MSELRGFARAQREWENATPPEWKGSFVASRDCDAEVPVSDDDDTLVPCGWTGDVDVYYDTFDEYWECPQCGHEVTEERVMDE